MIGFCVGWGFVVRLIVCCFGCDVLVWFFVWCCLLVVGFCFGLVGVGGLWYFWFVVLAVL